MVRWQLANRTSYFPGSTLTNDSARHDRSIQLHRNENLAERMGFQPMISSLTGKRGLLAPPTLHVKKFWRGRWDLNPQVAGLESAGPNRIALLPRVTNLFSFQT